MFILQLKNFLKKTAISDHMPDNKIYCFHCKKELKYQSRRERPIGIEGPFGDVGGTQITLLYTCTTPGCRFNNLEYDLTLEFMDFI